MPFVYLLRHESYECENFSAIASEELMSITKSIQSEISRKGKVAVHCRMGNGRTGTVLGNMIKTQLYYKNVIILRGV